MNVLEPVGEKGPAPGRQPVAAHWQRVVVAPRDEPLNAAGDCELSEQVKTSILPLFATRNIAYNSTCVPHQLRSGARSCRPTSWCSCRKTEPAP